MFHFGVDLADVVTGNGPAPSLVLLMVQRLPDTSMTAALATGGREHFGWGTDRHLMAHLIDALNQNTRATGQWKKKPPEIPAVPRPKPQKQTTPQPGKPGQSPLASIHRMLSGGGR